MTLLQEFVSRDAHPTVYVIEEGVFGVLLNLGAYASTVSYSAGGHVYEVILENDEFIVRDKISDVIGEYV